MRSKEVEEAIDDFNFFNEGEYITKEMVESKDTVLSYISELEKGIERLKKKNKELSNEIIDVKVDKVTKNFIHKDVIREKIKELEQTKGDFATYIAVSERIQVLKEILGEEYDN